MHAIKLTKQPHPSILLSFSFMSPSTFFSGNANPTTRIATAESGTLMYCSMLATVIRSVYEKVIERARCHRTCAKLGGRTKHHLQDAFSVKTPPITGPVAVPIATTTPMMPWYFPLSWRETTSDTTIVTTVTMPPPPIPAIAPMQFSWVSEIEV